MTATLLASVRAMHKDAACHETHRVNINAGRSSGRVAGVVTNTGEETWSPKDVFKMTSNDTVIPDGSEHSRTVDSASGNVTEATSTPALEYATAESLRYDHEGMMGMSEFHNINAQ